MELLFRTSKIIIWKVWFKSFLSMTFSFRIQMYRCRQVDFLMLMSIKLCQKCWKIFCKNFNTVKIQMQLTLIKMFAGVYTFTVWNKWISLSEHINNKRLLSSFVLLLRLSKRGTMPDTITELPLFFNDVFKSMIDFAI